MSIHQCKLDWSLDLNCLFLKWRWFLLCDIILGHVQRSREKPDAQTVCCTGHGPGSRQTVLPCPGAGPQEDLPGQEPGIAESTLCPVPVYADHRHPHQNVCQHPDLPGPALAGGYCGRGVHSGGPVHSPWDRGAQGHHQR